MSREWKPGDVATISTRPLIYLGDDRWADSFGTQLRLTSGEPRPLVVIDPEDREAVERLVTAIERVTGGTANHRAGDDMQAALREYANPTPPRPDEPKGLGAVVEDEGGVLWFRMAVENQTWPGEVWQEQYGDADRWSKWDSVAAVRVLSPGVEVDQ